MPSGTMRSTVSGISTVLPWRSVTVLVLADWATLSVLEVLVSGCAALPQAVKDRTIAEANRAAKIFLETVFFIREHSFFIDLHSKSCRRYWNEQCW